MLRRFLPGDHLLHFGAGHIIATRSGYLINEDEPEVIVEMIQQMVMQVREQKLKS